MAKSYKFGLLGHNISYSKSSEIFESIFRTNKINGSFENFDLPENGFEIEFEKIVKSGVDGLSVTIPFKNKVIPMLNEVSTVAKALNAVNSIAITNNQMFGYNTDISGFSKPLAEYASRLKNGTALILGSGGSARAVIYALHTDYEISKILVVGRTVSNLTYCKNAMQKILLNSNIDIVSYDKFDSLKCDDFNIVVNCTPLGGWNLPDISPLPAGFNFNSAKIYYDLNYNKNNKTIYKANECGLISLDGSRMLVGQALRSFEIWTGQTVEFDIVLDTVFGENAKTKRNS